MRVKIGRPLIELIKLCYRANRPPLLIGTHGVGKSQILEQAARELSIDYLCRDLSVMEPPDLVGLPQLDGGVTRFVPPAFWPRRGKGIIVFEELNRCPSYVRAPCLQLLTTRSVNDYRLPAGWLPAAAINPAGGEYEVTELDPALQSRFVVIEAEADREGWLSWARSHGVHPDVIAYVASELDIFSGPLSTPRSWEYVSDILHAQAAAGPETVRAAIAGQVGEERALAFLTTLQARVRPLTAAEVFAAYDAHRAELRGWVANGRLDLVQASLLAVLKNLQPRRGYEDVKGSRPRWKNLRAFVADLPGDLREQANGWFRERSYTLPRALRA